MNLLTDPITKQPPRAADTHTAIQWLDTLSLGACDQDEFLGGVGDMLQRAPDAGWELLALLDQYYRRGKISADVFGKLKTHLQDLLMGGERGHEVSAPVPAPPPARPLATPAPTPVATFVPPAVTSTMTPAVAPDAVATPAATPAPPAERIVVPGDVLRGRYRVQAVLGQGGRGTVYEAIDEYRLDRSHGEQRVALKVLREAVTKRPRLFTELRREFQHLQGLSHPNIVRVHEFDREGELAFFTMECLSGALLTRVLAAHDSAPLPRPYALSILRDVGAAVAYAHSRGIVHGDLNPANIFITDDGEVRVLDFGASHQLRRGPWISEFETSQQPTVATAGYASCQVLEGEPADARDDTYALACVAYVLLTGSLPFRGQSALQARTQRLTPERPRALGRQQWNVLLEGLHFERDRRPPDTRAWLARLDLGAAAEHLPVLATLLTHRPPPRRPVHWTAVGAVGGLLLACTWWTTTHGDSLTRANAAIGATLRSTFANTVVSQWWESEHADRAKPLSRASAPAPAPTPEPAPEPAPAPPPENAAPVMRRPETAPAAAAVTSITPASTTPASTASASAPRAPVASTPRAATAPAATRMAAVGQESRAAAGSPVHARVELAADNVELVPAETLAHVLVRRSRTLRGDVSFSWWTESGTAKPGRDFVPVKSHVEHIEDGQNGADLQITVHADAGRHDSRSFYVVIDEASDNAALGPRTLTMVTIPGAD